MSIRENVLFGPGEASFKLNYEIINYNRGNPSMEIAVHATREELSRLEHDGFLQRQRLFNEHQLAVLRAAVDEVVAAEIDHPNKEHYPGNGIFIRYLMDKHP
ncbi:hypothetical protein, partial [Pseudomonas aeruginosa]|uniref:hypothetical protein n=1 Tax=Pseudomonas aeruginosa TaxID=287 RepID=UPI001E651CD2